MLKKLRKYEEITDKLEIEITEYITKLSKNEITQQTSVKLRSTINISNDLERIGDVFYQTSKIYERKIEEKLTFNKEQNEGLLNLLDLIDKAFEVLINNLSEPTYDNVTLEKAKGVEAEINAARDALKDYDLTNIGKEGYNVQSSMIFNNLFSLLEKVGDHIMNINEAIVGKI